VGKSRLRRRFRAFASLAIAAIPSLGGITPPLIRAKCAAISLSAFLIARCTIPRNRERASSRVTGRR
jgi:hypothetical protein